MVFVMCFLAGVGVGALLAYHFANVAALKRKAAERDQDS